VYKAKKNLGQNFLKDDVVLQNIKDYVNPSKEDNFLEIGPGEGCLTEIFSPLIKSLNAVELDKDLLLGLKLLEQKEKSLTVHNKSILNFDLNSLSTNQELRVIGNLPYNISSSIVLWSLKNIHKFKDMHYMFQKEFGQRLFAEPKTKNYGRLSIISQYMTKITYLFTILPESFRPQPAVDSVFIKLTPIPGRNIQSQEAIKLQEITQAAFSMRRKMLRTSMKGLMKEKDFIHLDLNPEDRPEDLSVEDFIKISNFLIDT